MGLFPPSGAPRGVRGEGNQTRLPKKRLQFLRGTPIISSFSGFLPA